MGRPTVQVVGAPNLGHMTVMEYRHPVSQDEGLVLIVCDEHRGDTKFDEKVVDLRADLGAQGRVQVGKGLIHEKHRWPRCQGTRQGHSLLLASGERPRHSVGHGLKADKVQGLPDPVGALFPAG